MYDAAYLDILSLQDGADGVKLGVSEHHCRDLLKKLGDGSDRKALIDRLADLEKAKKLSEEHRENVTATVLDKILTDIIVRKGVVPSTSLQLFLLERKMKGHFGSDFTRENLQAWLRHMRPWGKDL